MRRPAAAAAGGARGAGIYYMFLLDTLEPREEGGHGSADADR